MWSIELHFQASRIRTYEFYKIFSLPPNSCGIDK